MISEVALLSLKLLRRKLESFRTYSRTLSNLDSETPHVGEASASQPTGVQMDNLAQEPNPGRKGGYQKWDYLPVENGTTTAGFLAAYPYGVYCHHTGGSKPCLVSYTRGALACPRCNPDKPAEWRGFTAIWDREYVPRFVIVTGDYLEAIREIPIGSLIEVSRKKAKYSPCVIRQHNWRTLPLPPSAKRSEPVDIVPALLKQWKMPELTLWYFAQPKEIRSVSPVTLPVDVPPVIQERMRPGTVPTAEAVDAKLDEVLGNLVHKGKRLARGKPSANGTHPPPSDS